MAMQLPAFLSALVTPTGQTTRKSLRVIYTLNLIYQR